MALLYSSSFDQTIAFSDTDLQFHLTDGLAVNYTLPGDYKTKYTLLFGLPSTTNLFVGYNVTAVIPAVNTVTTTQGIEFITPDSKRYANGGDVLSLITPDATAYVGISIRGITN